MLAARTIGMSREGVKPVGLEGAYDSILKGISGQRLMQKIAGDVWRPINDENEVEPKDGSDLYTTIDINIQDVAENALLKTLVKNNASHGCAILMEVKTGKIKAIANLSRAGKDSTSSYSENLNYAIGYATEPGSTFKLASYLAVIDDYDLSLEEKIQVGNGEVTYYNKTMSTATLGASGAVFGSSLGFHRVEAQPLSVSSAIFTSMATCWKPSMKLTSTSLTFRLVFLFAST